MLRSLRVFSIFTLHSAFSSQMARPPALTKAGGGSRLFFCPGFVQGFGSTEPLFRTYNDKVTHNTRPDD